jgi:metal-responsive CopG/Arc/MetJ family transcriptional regulator
MSNTGIYLPHALMSALSRMADKKGISRNALIAQLLTKAAKKYIEEVQG